MPEGVVPDVYTVVEPLFLFWLVGTPSVVTTRRPGWWRVQTNGSDLVLSIDEVVEATCRFQLSLGRTSNPSTRAASRNL